MEGVVGRDKVGFVQPLARGRVVGEGEDAALFGYVVVQGV